MGCRYELDHGGRPARILPHAHPITCAGC
jgi:hypothetical protein